MPREPVGQYEEASIPASFTVYKLQSGLYCADSLIETAKDVHPDIDAAKVIQAAIDAANTAGGGSLFFKKGTYSIGTTALNPKSDVSLIGGNAGSTILQLIPGTSRHILDQTGTLSNFALRNLTIDGNNANQSNAGNRDLEELVHIVTGAITSLTIKDCIFRNAHGGAAIDIGSNTRGNSASTNTLIDGCQFLDNGVTGAAFTCDHIHIGYAEGGRIVNSYFNNCTDTAIATDNSNNMSVANCRIIDTRGGLSFGVGTSGDSDRGFRYTMSNTHIEQTLAANIGSACFSSGSGGAYNGGTEVTFLGCTFVNNQVGAAGNLINLTKPDQYSFIGCHFQSLNSTNTSQYCLNYSLDGSAASRLMVNNCNFDMVTGGTRGIFLNNCTGFQINNNIFRNSDRGIGLLGSASADGRIVNNIFENCATAILPSPAPTTTTITRNLGYNPIGIGSITVTASPFIYTNTDVFPQAVYIFGGTVSQVAKDAVNLFTTTNVTVWLEPGEAVTITYSSAPTMKKDRK